MKQILITWDDDYNLEIDPTVGDKLSSQDVFTMAVSTYVSTFRNQGFTLEEAQEVLSVIYERFENKQMNAREVEL